MKSISATDNLKSAVRAIPFLGHLVSMFHRQLFGNEFTTSKQYWEERYKTGKNSGPGSYGRLAVYKAKVINQFIDDHNVSSMIEFGCGDGAQLKLLNTNGYTGVDVSSTILEQAKRKYAGDPGKTFLSLSDYKLSRSTFEAAISLDVIYHLVEDEVFHEYMELLFASAEKHVVIYSSNKNEQPMDLHVRHRKFSDWIDQNAPEWKLIREEKNPYEFDWKNPRNTSFADFYFYQKQHG